MPVCTARGSFRGSSLRLLLQNNVLTSCTVRTNRLEVGHPSSDRAQIGQPEQGECTYSCESVVLGGDADEAFGYGVLN